MNTAIAQNLAAHFELSEQFHFILTDRTGRVAYANPLFLKSTGYSSREIPHLNLAKLIGDNHKANFDLALEECLERCVFSVDLPFRRKDGTAFNLSFELIAIQSGRQKAKYVQWVGVLKPLPAALDVDGDEGLLKRSELFYRNLIADSLDGILLTSETGIISFVSGSVKKILGYEQGELIGKLAFDFLHPDDRELGYQTFLQEIENKQELRSITVRALKKSGEWLWVMIRGHNMFANPHVGAMLIYFCDDTSRKMAEVALQESEQRFRHLIHNLKLGVILVNNRGEIVLFNQATADMFKMSEKELIGLNILENGVPTIHEDGSRFDPYDFPVAQTINYKKSVSNVVMGIVQTPPDEPLWLLVSSEPVLDEHNEIVYIISSFTNISEQKKLSGQVLEQQKQLMQATIDAQEKERKEIGRELHDNISQHITTTRLYLEVARDKASGEVLNMINQAHKGLLDTVSEMRQLSQSLVPPSLSDIGLIASIEDLCAPLRKMHTFRITFRHAQFEEGLLSDNMRLMVFRIVQEQINNIIRHAHAEKITINLQTEADRVVLSVTDDGRGFDPGSVKRGLGFSNISNRAGLFGGRLKVTSAPGKGCSIHVEIPILQSA